MCYPPESLHRSSHFFAATLVYFWLTVYQSSAQSLETAFGQFRALPTPGKFERFQWQTATESSKTIWLWNPRTTKIVTASFDSSFVQLETQEHFTSEPFDNVLLTDVDGDKKTDALLIQQNEQRIVVVTDLSRDTLRPVSVLTLPIHPFGVAIGDINNDKKQDLVVFDKDNPGMLLFFGSGKGTFRPGKPIAPDNPIGCFALVHLNNDDILDLVAYDWVKSEVHLLYGVGQGQFLDQTHFFVDGEVKEILPTQLSAKGNLDLVLWLRHPSAVEKWEGNGLGDFHSKSRIAIKGQDVALGIADVNNDGFKDLAVLERPSLLQIYLNTGDELATERFEFSAGVDSRRIAFGDANADSLTDALLLDREGERLLLYYSSKQKNVLNDSLELLTGARPRGLIIEDLDGDGLNDVALANAGSKSISLFMNHKDDGLIGQTTYSLASNPRYLGFHSSHDSTVRFIVSYPQANQLSFLTVDFKENSTVSSVIPTAGEAELLSWTKGDPEQVEFFCYNSSPGSANPSLAFFQQIGPLRFIERNFRLTIPNVLHGAAVTDLNNDNFPDVCYIFRNSAGKYEFAVSLGDSALSFKQKVFSYELPEKVIDKSHFWPADFDRDGKMDLLVSFPQQPKTFRVVRGKGDGTFFLPDTIATDVHIADRSQIEILDIDGDDLLDVAVNEMDRSAIGWMKGKANAQFEEFRPLVSAPRIGHFAFGDINGDGVPDLAITLSDHGTVKLYDGKMLLKSRGYEASQ